MTQNQAVASAKTNAFRSGERHTAANRKGVVEQGCDVHGKGEQRRGLLDYRDNRQQARGQIDQGANAEHVHPDEQPQGQHGP